MQQVKSKKRPTIFNAQYNNCKHFRNNCVRVHAIEEMTQYDRTDLLVLEHLQPLISKISSVVGMYADLMYVEVQLAPNLSTLRSAQNHMSKKIQKI